MPAQKTIETKQEESLEAINAKLKAEVAALQRENREKSELIENQQARIEKLIAKGAGWLVIAANPLYDGEIYNIKFISGQAWIPVDRVFPRFVHEPMKDTQIEKYKKEEQAAIREREKTPSSKRAVDALVSDFGFRATFFDGKDQGALQDILDARVKERAELQAKLDEETSAMNVKSLIAPHLMGRG